MDIHKHLQICKLSSQAQWYQDHILKQIYFGLDSMSITLLLSRIDLLDMDQLHRVNCYFKLVKSLGRKSIMTHLGKFVILDHNLVLILRKISQFNQEFMIVDNFDNHLLLWFSLMGIRWAYIFWELYSYSKSLDILHLDNSTTTLHPIRCRVKACYNQYLVNTFPLNLI